MDTLSAAAAPLWNAFTAKTIVVSTLEVVELITGASGITIQWTTLLGTGRNSGVYYNIIAIYIQLMYIASVPIHDV